MAYGRRHSRLPDGPDLFDFADQHNTLSRQSQTSPTPTSEAGQEVKPLISAQRYGQQLCSVADKLIEITSKSQTQLTQSQVRDAMSMVFGGLIQQVIGSGPRLMTQLKSQKSYCLENKQTI